MSDDLREWAVDTLHGRRHPLSPEPTCAGCEADVRALFSPDGKLAKELAQASYTAVKRALANGTVDSREHTLELRDRLATVTEQRDRAVAKNERLRAELADAAVLVKRRQLYRCGHGIHCSGSGPDCWPDENQPVDATESQLATVTEQRDRLVEALAPFCDLNHQGNPALRRDAERARALCAAHDDARAALSPEQVETKT